MSKDDLHITDKLVVTPDVTILLECIAVVSVEKFVDDSHIVVVRTKDSGVYQLLSREDYFDALETKEVISEALHNYYESNNG